VCYNFVAVAGTRADRERHLARGGQLAENAEQLVELARPPMADVHLQHAPGSFESCRRSF
jgi:hypothetical protein